MFTSSSLSEHLVRGVVGIGTLWVAIWMGTDAGWLGVLGSLFLGLLSFAALGVRACVLGSTIFQSNRPDTLETQC